MGGGALQGELKKKRNRRSASGVESKMRSPRQMKPIVWEEGCGGFIAGEGEVPCWKCVGGDGGGGGVRGPAAPPEEPGSREDRDGIEHCTSPSVLVKVLRAVEAAAKNVSARPSRAA